MRRRHPQGPRRDPRQRLASGCRCACRWGPGPRVQSARRPESCPRTRRRWSGRSEVRVRRWRHRAPVRREPAWSQRPMRCSYTSPQIPAGWRRPVRPMGRGAPMARWFGVPGWIRAGSRCGVAVRRRDSAARHSSTTAHVRPRNFSGVLPCARPALARKRARSSSGAPHRGGGLPSSKPELSAGTLDLRRNIPIDA